MEETLVATTARTGIDSGRVPDCVLSELVQTLWEYGHFDRRVLNGVRRGDTSEATDERNPSVRSGYGIERAHSLELQAVVWTERMLESPIPA